MGGIDTKIELANQMCCKDYKQTFATKFNHIYPFTTENIGGYLPFFSLEGKSLLTVGSSGDQVINAILSGCYLIQVCDICPFTKEYFELKKAAIIALDRNEFINFFTKHGNFNRYTYDRIREVLSTNSEDATYFWDELFKNNSQRVVRYKGIFSHDEYRTGVVTQTNPYLKNDDNFKLIKGEIEKATIVFTNQDIFDISTAITFDNIFLSNIASYYSRDKIKELFLRMEHKLLSDGKVLIAYLYDTDLMDQTYSSDNDIYNLYSTLKYFPGSTIDSFTGVSGLRMGTSCMRDSVLCYKKVKKINK